MIVVPVRPSQNHNPCTYRKKTYKESEIVGAECKVNVTVTFPETFALTKTKPTFGENPIIVFDRECKPEIAYGFTVKVNLDKKEYETYKCNLEEYVCDKVKEQNDYKERLKECLDKEFCSEDYKGYTVKTYINPDTIKFKTVENEVEEYVPIIYE